MLLCILKWITAFIKKEGFIDGYDRRCKDTSTIRGSVVTIFEWCELERENRNIRRQVI